MISRQAPITTETWFSQSTASQELHSTFQGASQIPFQRWFKFKEAYSPLLVRKVFEEAANEINSCLDPCGGCGTTAVTAQFMGVEPTIIEINPFLADVVRAKTESYDGKTLIDEFYQWIKLSKSLSPDIDIMYESAPTTLFEKPGMDKWVFNRALFYRIAQLVAALSSVECENVRRLFRVLLGAQLVQLSNVLISGKGRKYRKNWQLNEKSPKHVHEALVASFQHIIHDISRYRKLNSGYTVIHGDARSNISVSSDVDIAIFSPPYPNSFDYTDIYQLELWVLRYISTRSGETALRKSTIRSHVQRPVDPVQKKVSTPTLDYTLEALHLCKSRLWSNKIPDMIEAYFADISSMMECLQQKVVDGGDIALVVGDSAYAGIRIPVGEILTEMSESLKLSNPRRDVLRVMKGSAQQGWTKNLNEEMVRFRV